MTREEMEASGHRLVADAVMDVMRMPEMVSAQASMEAMDMPETLESLVRAGATTVVARLLEAHGRRLGGDQVIEEVLEPWAP